MLGPILSMVMIVAWSVAAEKTQDGVARGFLRAAALISLASLISFGPIGG